MHTCIWTLCISGQIYDSCVILLFFASLSQEAWWWKVRHKVERTKKKRMIYAMCSLNQKMKDWIRDNVSTYACVLYVVTHKNNNNGIIIQIIRFVLYWTKNNMYWIRQECVFLFTLSSIIYIEIFHIENGYEFMW